MCSFYVFYLEVFAIWQPTNDLNHIFILNHIIVQLYFEKMAILIPQRINVIAHFFIFWDFWLFWKLPSGQRDLNIDKLTSFDTLDRFPEQVAIYSIWSFQITPYDPFKLRSRSPFSVFQSFCSSKHWRIIFG